MQPRFALDLLWVVWVVSWYAVAAWSDRVGSRASSSSQVAYRVLAILGALLLFPRSRFGHSWIDFWNMGPGVAWALVTVAVAGFLFAWWARITLGALWSSSVTKKADHHLVETGPYAIVRHPIYTGLMLAIVATALFKGTLPALVGGALMIAGCWSKARLEERFLREELGSETYDSYRRRVPMLVPFGPKAA